jgi:GTP cyclohydrolase I
MELGGAVHLHVAKKPETKAGVIMDPKPLHLAASRSARRNGNGHRPDPAGPLHGISAEQDLEHAVRRLLAALGEDPRRDGLRDTPKRVAKALLELTQGYEEDPAEILGRTFPEPYHGLVVVRGIEFSSLCEHHMLPFRGSTTIAYLPKGKVVGLSKLSRLVQAFARRLQVQERLTQQIACAIQEHVKPRGVAVLVEAEHACMSMRGVRTPATTVTTTFLGELSSPEARQEFLAQARAGPRGA